MPQATRLFATAGSVNPAEYELHTADVSRTYWNIRVKSQDTVFHPSAVFVIIFVHEVVILIVQGLEVIEEGILLCFQSEIHSMAESAEWDTEKGEKQ